MLSKYLSTGTARIKVHKEIEEEYKQNSGKWIIIVRILQPSTILKRFNGMKMHTKKEVHFGITKTPKRGVASRD